MISTTNKLCSYKQILEKVGNKKLDLSIVAGTFWALKESILRKSQIYRNKLLWEIDLYIATRFKGDPCRFLESINPQFQTDLFNQSFSPQESDYSGHHH